MSAAKSITGITGAAGGQVGQVGHGGGGGGGGVGGGHWEGSLRLTGCVQLSLRSVIERHGDTSEHHHYS